MIESASGNFTQTLTALPLARQAESSRRELTPEQQRQVDQLKRIDKAVRAHEQAHVAAGADLVRGGATYSYQTGPDNKRYAVAGEVRIDTSPGRTPEETLPKAQRIRETALAPADPSPQDRSVAAKASRMEAGARAEIAQEQRAESSGEDTTEPTAIAYRRKETGDNTQMTGVFIDVFA